MTITVHHGDCREVLRTLEDASIDSVVTDPPYGLEFMGKEWDTFKTGRSAKYSKGGELHDPADRRGKGGAGPSYVSRPAKRCRLCGKQKWSGSPCQCPSPEWEMDHSPLYSFQSWCEEWAREVYRVLKPGGHLLSFGGTRTYHRMVCAIEDAGFEIRDTIMWVYGSGFPKSLDVSKAIDRRREDNTAWQAIGQWLKSQRVAAGLSAKTLCGVIGAHGDINHGGAVSNWENGFSCPTWEQWLQLKSVLNFGDEMDAEVWRLNGRKGAPGEGWEQRAVTGQHDGHAFADWETNCGNERFDAPKERRDAPATDAAKQWQGWGTALKPAVEPIVLARKPLIGTVAENVLAHGTGALNIDGCRVEADEKLSRPFNEANNDILGKFNRFGNPIEPSGRWPANLIHDGSAEVEAAFKAYGEKTSGKLLPTHDAKPSENGSMSGSNYAGRIHSEFGGDTGTAARFFYSSKADADDRLGSKHPTVKPVDLMAYLCRLVTPPGGRILDPFAGSGTTGMAAMREGFDCVLIEREADYVKDIKARIAHVRGEDTPLFGGAE